MPACIVCVCEMCTGFHLMPAVAAECRYAQAAALLRPVGTSTIPRSLHRDGALAALQLTHAHAL